MTLGDGVIDALLIIRAIAGERGDSPVDRRWCMNTVWVASPPQACVLFDTDGDRHAEAGHSVERVAGDFRLGLLIGQSPGMQTPADDRLVAIHRRLHEASPAI